MEVKQHFKCKLWRTDLERFRLICKFLDIPMSVMCGALIENFNEKMGDRLKASDCVKKGLCLEVHEEFELIRKELDKILER